MYQRAMLLFVVMVLGIHALGQEAPKGSDLIHQDIVIGCGSKDGVFVGMDFELPNSIVILTVIEVRVPSRIHYQRIAEKGKRKSRLSSDLVIKPEMKLFTAEY